MYRSVIDSEGGPEETRSSSESSESRGWNVSKASITRRVYLGVYISEQKTQGIDTHTCVNEVVVGFIVVSDRTGLCLIELRIFDFFELHHDWLRWQRLCFFGFDNTGKWNAEVRCDCVGELVYCIVLYGVDSLGGFFCCLYC